MMDSLLKRIEKSKKAHGRWIAMVLCLSMLVSLGTFAGFRKTAVAKVYTREVLDCPYTHEGAEPVAHVHNDDCYDGDTLVCTLPELEAHTHSDACYTERQVLTCTLEENPGHQHTDACYVEHKVQSCGLEENPGHVHNGTCYNESGVLICQIPEGEGAHTHTDDCYTVERELTCAIPEGEGAHTHGAECFETVRELTCGKAELTPHVHGPECIRTEEITVDEPEETVEPKVTAESEVTAQPEVNTEPEVTAQPEASAAPEMPVSDPNADLESASDWERDFDGMELSGNWAKDLVLVAATQQGHGESQNNFEAVLNDAGDAWVKHGYTRYGAWSGAPYADEWSAMFVSFCLRYAGIPAENVPNNLTAALMAESFQKGELFAGPDYLPAVGDLIFFDTDDEEGIDHMGIVYHVDAENGSINTVEGSRTDAVETFGYHLDDEEIAGYGILPQNPDYTPVEENTEDVTDNLIVMSTDEEEEKKETEEVKPVEETKTAEEVTVPAVPMPAQSWERTAGGIKVTVDAPEGAFPENTKIAITPVNGNSLKDTVSDAVSGEVLEVQAVDITFFDADGNEIEPAVPIRVVMTPAETEHAEEKTNVVHIDLDQQTAEVIEQAAGTETDNSEVVFDADAFTIYAIVYTYQVEYEYEVDGKTFTSASMPGAENMTLAKIVEGLGIVDETEIDTFVSKIASITSTNEEVAIVNEDNEIRVLKDGEAKIVITMQDGAKFRIDVRAEGETSASNETATVSTVGELYLPAEAELKTEVLDEVKSESAIAAVEAKEGTTNSNAAVASAYQVFDISLENVPADQYDGFQVEVKLPENVIGRDFRLFHIHDGETTEINLNTVSRPADDTGLEVVSGFTFETNDFSEFVLKYTVDFTYEGRTLHFPGQGSYRLAEILAELGIEGTIDEAFLTLIEGEDHEGALFLTQEDGEYYLNSLIAFTDIYELKVQIGEKAYLITVTDLQYTNSLNDVLTDLTINGAEWDAATESYTVKPGKSYTVNMTFQESEKGYQFSNDDWMTLTLPAGVKFESVGTFPITVNEAGENFTITGNEIETDGDTVRIKFNNNDPNYKKLKDITTAKFTVSVTGKFNSNQNGYVIEGQTDTKVKVDDTPDVNVTKSGSLIDWNSDASTAKVQYRLEVRSNGAASGVEISDIISGTGLTFDGLSSITVKEGNNTITDWQKSQEGNGFKMTTGNLEDGKTYVVEYTATINKSQLVNNANGTYDLDANNTVTWPGKPSITNHDLDHVVSKPGIYKGAASSSQNGGVTTTTWKIEADSDYGTANQLKTITDRMASDGMTYGDKLHIVVTDKVTGALVKDDYVNLEAPILANDRKSWSYDVSTFTDGGNSNKKYHYVITYDTTYDIGDATSGVTIKNDTVDNRGNEGHGQSNVSPNPENRYNLWKEYTSKETTTEGTIVTWTIHVTVPAAGVPADKAVLTETLPSTGSYQDTYAGHDDNWVTGLLSGETVKVTVNNDGTVLFTFTKDGTNPGLKANGNPVNSDTYKARDITLTIKTKCDSNWMNDNQDGTTTNQTHDNKVNFVDRESHAYFTPDKPRSEKRGQRDGEDGGLPKFTYDVVVGVISDDLFNGDTTYTGTTVGEDDTYGKYVEFTDTFDPRLAYVGGSAEVYGGDQYYQGNGNNPASGGVTAKPDDGNSITFRLYQNSLPKNNGNLYQYYRVHYSLKVTSEDKLKDLRDEAISTGKAVVLGNSVTGFGGSSFDVNYEPKVLDKSHQTVDGKLEFTIKVNEEGLKLSDDGVLVLTDDMTNLSVGYQDVTVSVAGDKTVETTDADGNPVTAPYFNMKGNRLTFYLPDEAAVTIKYRATPRGEVGSDGKIHYSNTAKLLGFEKTDSGEKDYQSEASGYGTNYGVYIYKADGNVNSNALGGAEFKLYEADEVDANGNIVSGTPVKMADGSDYTVTTSDGKDGSQKGLVLVMGTEELGWNLKPEKRYYLLETKAPEGYALDSTKYSFIISKDGFVNYTSSPVVAPDGSGKLVQAWTYHNGDVMTVKNYRKDGVLTLEKSFDGNIDPSKMTDDQKAAIKFEIYTISGEGSETTETLWRTITYDQFTAGEDGKYTYTIGDLPEGKYKVKEIVDDATCKTTTYQVTDTDADAEANNTSENKDERYATVVISAEDVSNHTENKVDVTNTYEIPSELNIFKHAEGETSYKVAGAKFGVFEVEDASWNPTGDSLATYTTNARGRFSILKDAAGSYTFEYDKVYALIETKAPAGFLPNETPVYFYFQSEGNSSTPTAPYGKQVVVIPFKETKEQNISDTPDTTSLEATKVYLNDLLEPEDPDGVTSVNVRIKQIASYDKAGKVVEDELSGYYKAGQTSPVKAAAQATPYQIVKENDTWHLSDNGVEDGKLTGLPTMTFDNHIPIYYHYEVEEINPGDYIPSYEYVTNEDGSTTATVTNKPKNSASTTQFKVEKKWVDVDGNDVTSTMSLDDEVKVKLYRTEDVVTRGTIYEADGTTKDPTNQFVITAVDRSNRGTVEPAALTVLPSDVIRVEFKPLTMLNNKTWADLQAPRITFKYTNSDVQRDNERQVFYVEYAIPSGLQTIDIYEESNQISSYAITVENISARGRTQVLTQADVSTLIDAAFPVETLTLSKLNSWRATSKDVITSVTTVTYPNPNNPWYSITTTRNYSYFFVEENGSNFNAEYTVSGDTSIVTNVDKKLEIDKQWLAANEDDITADKTEGSVTYTIKRNSYVTPVPQQINPVQWTGTTPYYGPNQNSHTVISSVEGIKVGATVKMTLRLSQDQSDAADDSFDGLVITGAKIISKTESFNVYPILGNNNHYAAREYVLEITDKDVIISGQLEVNQSHDQNSTFYIDFKLLKEPSSIYIPSDTDEPTDSGETVGTVTVDYDSIVAAEFTDENIKATVGSTPWSVVINKLPGSDGTNTYTYYVEEEVAASDEFENVSITPSQGTPVGGKVQVVNKLKSGELKVKKAVAGAAPADKTYEIAVRDAEGNYFGTDGTNYGQIPHYETFRANDEKIWTPLTPGKFTVSEKDASVAGYTWTVSGTGDITVVQGDTAETTVTNSYFKNTEYTPKVTKSLMVGNEEVTSWPDGVSFDFYLSFVEGYQGSGSDKVVLSRNDIVMSNREATATEDSKTAIFERREKDSESETETVQPGITFKKPGTYVFTIEEVEPAGTQNHKRNGIVYSTEKVTLTVVVGEKSGDPGVLEVVRKTYSRANGQTDDALGGLITNTLDYPSYAPSVAKSLKDGEAEASTEVWNGKSFTFNLAIASSMTNELKANVIMPNTAEKTVNKDSTDHKETFDAISFKAEGTYTFTMTESIPGDATNAEGKKYSEASEEEKAAGGFKYNSVEYVAGPKTIDVMVESDEDGNLSVTKVTIDGTEVTGESIIGSGATFENKLVQNGALRLTKVVKYKDNAPTADEYQYVDGGFIFKVSRTVDEEGGTPEVVKYVQITVSDGQASSYKIANSETELAEATSHKGQYALITDLPAGDYTIEEVGRNGLMLVSFVRGDNDNSSVDVEKETVTVHVSESDSAAENTNAQATFTNNYFDNDGPDKITLDIIKTFSGISSLGDVPDGTDGFEVVVGYNLKGEEKTITLKKDQDETIADGIKIKASAKDLTISWHITGIPSEASSFKIKEVHYNNIPGYNFTKATLDKIEITSTAGDWHDMTVAAPTAQLSKVTDERNTPDSEANLRYEIQDTDILLSKLTANQGTLVISKKSLNSIERDAVKTGWPKQGGFTTPGIYFSIEEHPEGFSYGGKSITFSESDGKTYVTFTSNAAAQEDVFTVLYDSHTELNNASLTNEYSPKSVELEIVKVKKDDENTKLPGAQFTIRKIKDNLGASGVQYDGEESEPVTTGTNGEAKFENITQGYYEIRETVIPDGYIVTGERCFYIKVDNGKISLLKKQAGTDPKEWSATETEVGNVTFTAATESTAAKAQIENTPGTQLPQTGGIGTTLFTALGSIMTATAGAILTMKSWHRRKENA